MDWTFAVESEDRIIGRDPECADMDNPQGYLYRTYFFPTARNPYGRIYAHNRITIHPEVAQAWVEFIQARVTPDWTPENNPCWTFLRNCYGSQAYQDDGDEAATIAWERDQR